MGIAEHRIERLGEKENLVGIVKMRGSEGEKWRRGDVA